MVKVHQKQFSFSCSLYNLSPTFRITCTLKTLHVNDLCNAKFFTSEMSYYTEFAIFKCWNFLERYAEP